MNLKERQNCTVHALLQAAHESIGIAISEIENYDPNTEFEDVAKLLEAEKAVARAKVAFETKIDKCTNWRHWPWV